MRSELAPILRVQWTILTRSAIVLMLYVVYLCSKLPVIVPMGPNWARDAEEGGGGKRSSSCRRIVPTTLSRQLDALRLLSSCHNSLFPTTTCSGQSSVSIALDDEPIAIGQLSPYLPTCSQQPTGSCQDISFPFPTRFIYVRARSTTKDPCHPLDMLILWPHPPLGRFWAFSLDTHSPYARRIRITDDEKMAAAFAMPLLRGGLRNVVEGLLLIVVLLPIGSRLVMNTHSPVLASQSQPRAPIPPTERSVPPCLSIRIFLPPSPKLRLGTVAVHKLLTPCVRDDGASCRYQPRPTLTKKSHYGDLVCIVKCKCPAWTKKKSKEWEQIVDNVDPRLDSFFDCPAQYHHAHGFGPCVDSTFRHLTYPFSTLYPSTVETRLPDRHPPTSLPDSKCDDRFQKSPILHRRINENLHSVLILRTAARARAKYAVGKSVLGPHQYLTVRARTSYALIHRHPMRQISDFLDDLELGDHQAQTVVARQGHESLLAPRERGDKKGKFCEIVDLKRAMLRPSDGLCCPSDDPVVAGRWVSMAYAPSLASFSRAEPVPAPVEMAVWVNTYAVSVASARGMRGRRQAHIASFPWDINSVYDNYLGLRGPSRHATVTTASPRSSVNEFRARSCISTLMAIYRF
ncbi:hypothetical protein ACRALDRAFT_212492 [Sodiomyces alcalophilus JCM 7366]|uniref:uncharacterized protein n=1 Tax=Sodiomyces alcalophilus JCM 7366 TaxID=591952 RepID=UPI0039B55AD0